MKFKKPNLFILSIAICVIIIPFLVAHYLFRINYGISIGISAIIFLAIFLNGLLAEWEDNRPGGFNNPKKKD